MMHNSTSADDDKTQQPEKTPGKPLPILVRLSWGCERDGVVSKWVAFVV